MVATLAVHPLLVKRIGLPSVVITAHPLVVKRMQVNLPLVAILIPFKWRTLHHLVVVTLPKLQLNILGTVFALLRRFVPFAILNLA